MDALKQLEVDYEEKRSAVKAILAAVNGEKRATTDKERSALAGLTADLETLNASIRLERAQLDYDRGAAVAVDRATGGMGAWGGRRDDGDDAPALMLPPLPARTRRKLEAMAGGAKASTPEDQREHFAAVVHAALGGNPFHPALAPRAASENVGSEGGFAVRLDVAAGIWTRAAEGSVFFRIGARIETMISDTKIVVALDDDDESSDKEAGLTAGWTAEAGDPASQTMLIRQVELHAKKLQINAVVPNELAEDGPGYLDALDDAMSRGIAKKIDRACISGTGAGQFAGILGSAATIEVSKTVDGDPGTANTFTWKHAAAMLSRLAPGAYENAWWLVHPTVLPQLLSMHLKVMNVALSENVGGFQPIGAFAPGGPTGYMLLGRPVVITGRAKPLSSKGDVILLDPSSYVIGIRRQITVARSEHAYFSSDRLGVRGTFRGDGMSMWDTARTPQEGSTLVGPAVVLQAR